MSLKYLNLTGLSNLVTNIKNWVTARIPTKTSEITNDSGFITSSSLPTVNNATLTIQKNGTNVQTFTANASSNKTANITVPTKVSELTNDSGYLTAHQAVTNSAPTLSWGTTSTIGSVGGTDLTVTMPANPNTDTDTKVTQTVTTGSTLYPVIVGNTASATSTETSGVRFSPKLLMNTRYGYLRGFSYDSDNLKGVAPSATRTCGGSIQFYTYDGAESGRLWNEVLSDGSRQTYIRVTNYITNEALATDGTAIHTLLRLRVYPTGAKKIYCDGGWENNLIPDATNARTLGTSSRAWKEIYSNAYYLGSTAFGDIVTHNASEFLTSHQSLSNYVTLDGAQTISGGKTFTGTNTFQYTVVFKDAAAVSAGGYGVGLEFFDNSGNRYGYIQPHVTPDGTKNIVFGNSASGYLAFNSVPVPYGSVSLGRPNFRWGGVYDANSIFVYNAYTFGTAPSTNRFWGLWNRDSTGVEVADFLACAYSSGNNSAVLRCLNTDGTNTYDRRVELVVSQNGSTILKPYHNAQYDLGSGSYKWKSVYAQEYHAYNDNAFMANSGGYTFLIRNDGTNTYFLMSEQNGAEGTWSTARPLTIANSTGVCNINGNAATATKATGNASGNELTNTIIKGLSVSGKTITYTKIDGNTGTITTQDTVYTHPTTAGNKHIPSGGSTGKILRYSEAGTAAWDYRGVFISKATRTSTGNWTISSLTTHGIYLLIGTVKRTANNASTISLTNAAILCGYTSCNGYNTPKGNNFTHAGTTADTVYIRLMLIASSTTITVDIPSAFSEINLSLCV